MSYRDKLMKILDSCGNLKQACREADVPYDTIYKFTKREGASITAENLAKLANYFGFSLDELMGVTAAPSYHDDEDGSRIPVAPGEIEVSIVTQDGWPSNAILGFETEAGTVEYALDYQQSVELYAGLMKAARKIEPDTP